MIASRAWGTGRTNRLTDRIASLATNTVAPAATSGSPVSQATDQHRADHRHVDADRAPTAPGRDSRCASGQHPAGGHQRDREGDQPERDDHQGHGQAQHDEADHEGQVADAGTPPGRPGSVRHARRSRAMSPDQPEEQRRPAASGPAVLSAAPSTTAATISSTSTSGFATTSSRRSSRATAYQSTSAAAAGSSQTSSSRTDRAWQGAAPMRAGNAGLRRGALLRLSRDAASRGEPDRRPGGAGRRRLRGDCWPWSRSLLPVVGGLTTTSRPAQAPPRSSVAVSFSVVGACSSVAPTPTRWAGCWSGSARWPQSTPAPRRTPPSCWRRHGRRPAAGCRPWRWPPPG